MSSSDQTASNKKRKKNPIDLTSVSQSSKKQSNTTSSSNHVNHISKLEEEQQEATLLATIGTTITSQSTYETEVLREASYRHVPELHGIGFPDLASLAPSYRESISSSTKKAPNNSAMHDLPHILKVFRKVKSDLYSLQSSSSSYRVKNNIESKENHLLQIKFQILLTYLAHHSNLSKDDLGLDIAQEISFENYRKNRLLKQNEYASDTAIQPDSDSDNKKNPNNRKSRYGRNDFMSSSYNGPERLEAIKKGIADTTTVSILSTSKTGSFGKQALMAREQAIKIAQQKSEKHTVMSMKRKLVEDHGEEWIDPEELWKRRMERLERRRKKRERLLIKYDLSSNVGRERVKKSATRTITKKNRVKMEKPRKRVPDQLNHDIVLSDRTTPDTTNAKKSDKRCGLQKKESPNTVYCSICEQHLHVPKSSSDSDVYLSMHIQSCQGQRTTRRTSRRLRASTNEINYAEIDEDQEQGDYDNQVESNQLDSDENIGDMELSSDNDDDEDNEFDNDSTITTDQDENNSLPNQYIREPKIDDFYEDDYEDRVDDWIEYGIDRMKKMSESIDDEVKPGAVTFSGGLTIPAWINDRLFGYQRIGLQWLWELHQQSAGGIVGDEMGLGKTVQVCSYLGSMATSRMLRSVLIISPATMLSHWLSELETWAPGLRRILLHSSAEQRDELGSKRNVSTQLLNRLDKWVSVSRSNRLYEAIDEKDLEENDPNSFCGTGYVILTTYENLRRSPDTYVNHDWSYIVLDEGQKIRNPDADITLACKRLKSPHRLLLSGTPIQNDLKELWSLFDFCFPGRLGTLPVFEAEFADPIKRGGYSNASPMQVQLAYRCALVLRDTINPYLLRRQKKDIEEVSRMPGKTEQVLFCKLSKAQRLMYEAYLASDEVRNIIRGSAQCFKPIITLRKISNHPDLICGGDPASYESFLRNGYVNEQDIDNYSSDEDEESSINCFDMNYDSLAEKSGKLEVLAKILPLWKEQGHRVLIFSQWKKMLNIIQHFITTQGYKFSRMDGNTNVASRQSMVDKFNRDTSYFIMLLTTKTGGVGLNLIGADRVIIWEPDWNPQNDAQARERAWRFGQKNSVTIYRFVTTGTIEEKIYQRQIFKTALTNQVLQDPRQRRMFSQKDLRDLFTLKPDLDSISKGGYGVTETGEITKGRGVVDMKQQNSEQNESSQSKDDQDTIEVVLKTKGLAGIFDHTFVDEPMSKKSMSVREMEDSAIKAAKTAAKALIESTKNNTEFTPTWTGSVDTEPKRFGNVNTQSNQRGGGSGALLAHIRGRTVDEQQYR